MWELDDDDDNDDVRTHPGDPDDDRTGKGMGWQLLASCVYTGTMSWWKVSSIV